MHGQENIKSTGLFSPDGHAEDTSEEKENHARKFKTQ
jgi:hypothetical protein